MYQKSENVLFGVYALLFATLFYSAGNFGLLNLFDFRREFQVILFVMLAPLSVFMFANWQRCMKEPLYLLAILLLIGELFLRRRIIHVADGLVSVGILGVLFALKKREHDRILKCIIMASAIFSVMVIIQAIIVWFNPEVIDHFSSNYLSGTSSGKVEVGHPLEYLGFTVYYRGFYVLGHYFIRFQSFASEPSVLVYSFLVPGLLGLTYEGYFKIFSIPVLFFAIVLSGSGTVWLSVFMGVIFLCLFVLFRRFKMFMIVLPFILTIIYAIFLSSTDISLFARKSISFLSPFSTIHSEILHKHGSIARRLSSAQDYLVLIRNHPMGLRFSEDAPVGLFLNWYHNAGLPAMAMGCIVAFRIFGYSLYSFYGNKGLVKVAGGMIYGVFFTVLFFYGALWDTFVGMMMLFLTNNRLKKLTCDNFG